MHSPLQATLALVIVATMIASCGGSSSDDAAPTAQISNDSGISRGTVSGSASAGSKTLPEKSTVEIRGVDIDTPSVAVAADGRFEFENTNGPAILRIDTGDGQVFFAIVPDSGQLDVNINLHSYSDFIARNWYASQGLDIDTEFMSSNPLANLPDLQEYTQLVQEFDQVVSGVLQAYALADVDILTEPFVIDGTFIDGFLQANPLVINENEVTLTITDPTSLTQSTLLGGSSSPISLNTNFVSENDTPPDPPGNPRVITVSEQEVIVLWNPARDDKGVSGYRIFRDGEPTGSSAFPIFSDTGLMPNTSYTYQIQSIDSRGQLSALSPAAAGMTSSAPDTEPPPAPMDVSATAMRGIVRVQWNQAAINDVAVFNVTRDVPNESTETLVTTNFIDDLAILPGLEHCYVIEAVDGAGNRSMASERACITPPSSMLASMPDPTDLPDEQDPIVQLADCGSLPLSSLVPSTDIDQPSVFTTATLITGELSPSSVATSRHFWDIDLGSGTYFLIADYRRTGGVATNNFEITTLNAIGTEQSRLLRISAGDPRVRGGVFFTIDNTTTLRLQLETVRFSSEGRYTLGVFQNGSAIPSPYFSECPTVVQLSAGLSSSMSLRAGEDGYALVNPQELPADLVVDTVRTGGIASTQVSVQARFRFAEQSTATTIGNIRTTDPANRFAVRLTSIDNSDFAWIRFANNRFAGNVDIEFRLDQNQAFSVSPSDPTNTADHTDWF